MMIPFAGLRSALRLLLNQQEKKRAGNTCYFNNDDNDNDENDNDNDNNDNNAQPL